MSVGVVAVLLPHAEMLLQATPALLQDDSGRITANTRADRRTTPDAVSLALILTVL